MVETPSGGTRTAKKGKAAKREDFPPGVKPRGKRFTATGYDPEKRGSVHLGTCDTVEEAAELRRRHDRKLERQRDGFKDWYVDEFTAIWCVEDYLRPAPTTNPSNNSSVRVFGRDFAGVKLNEVSWDMARLWAGGGVVRDDLVWLAKRWQGAYREKNARGKWVWVVPSHAVQVKFVKLMFADAKKSLLIDRDEFADVAAPITPGRRDDNLLTEEQIEALIVAAQRRHPKTAFWAMILVTAFTGMRRGEACGLRWDDIDFKARTLEVERQLCAKTGQLRPPKYNSYRTLFLPPRAAEALLQVPRHPDGYVFHTARGRLFTERTHSYYWTNARELVASVPEGATFHKLRHFYATYLFEQGVELFDIAVMLGHKNPEAASVNALTSRVTQRYTHPTTAGSFDRVGAVFAK